ncbi:GNAT family N-acetyltransferase [Streptomyces sp. AP-93]|uniref:GNAT family N-acetyltransferase n=1 Tax=Streptomyces sp. AP-93 TaxID=2929048 RepID=UPI001FAED913|nr:GNAT family N-acetyltransferase [Streptomyces sp. AP-93]MCJ0874918.1 GNAT family N-acetyltransferase [Streptomyces sp. AP-93]
MTDNSGPLTVETRETFPAELLDVTCGPRSVSLSPRRLASMDGDGRWRTRWAVALIGGRVIGVLGAHRPSSARFSGGFYDLNELGEQLERPVPKDSRRWAVVGGCRDLAAGAVTDTRLDDKETARVQAALAAQVFGEADEAGDLPVALHVRREEAEAFAAGIGPRALVRTLDETANLYLTGDDPEQHIAALSPSQRERCRKDRRRFEALGYPAARVPAVSVLEEAAPLVFAVKAKYGVVDHPRLSLFRLREWVRAFGEDACHASVVRDDTGRLVAVSFFAVQGEVLGGYEIGLADDVPGREFAYLQAMIHGPVRYAFELGCRSIDLGLASATVKRRRGAVISETCLVTIAEAVDW